MATWVAPGARAAPAAREAWAGTLTRHCLDGTRRWARPRSHSAAPCTDRRRRCGSRCRCGTRRSAGRKHRTGSRHRARTPQGAPTAPGSRAEHAAAQEGTRCHACRPSTTHCHRLLAASHCSGWCRPRHRSRCSMCQRRTPPSAGHSPESGSRRCPCRSRAAMAARAAWAALAAKADGAAPLVAKAPSAVLVVLEARVGCCPGLFQWSARQHGRAERESSCSGPWPCTQPSLRRTRNGAGAQRRGYSVAPANARAAQCKRALHRFGQRGYARGSCQRGPG